MRQNSVVTGLLVITLVLVSMAAWGDANAPTGIKVNDNSLVPIRYIAEWLGATVTFDSVTNRIMLQTAKTKILLTTNSPKASIDEKEFTLQTPAIEKDGTTYVPLRFVAEGFHTGVDWDEAKQQATISNPDTGKTLIIPVSPGEQTTTAQVTRKSGDTKQPPVKATGKYRALTEADGLQCWARYSEITYGYDGPPSGKLASFECTDKNGHTVQLSLADNNFKNGEIVTQSFGIVKIKMAGSGLGGISYFTGGMMLQSVENGGSKLTGASYCMTKSQLKAIKKFLGW